MSPRFFVPLLGLWTTLLASAVHAQTQPKESRDELELRLLVRALDKKEATILRAIQKNEARRIKHNKEKPDKTDAEAVRRYNEVARAGREERKRLDKDLADVRKRRTVVAAELVRAFLARGKRPPFTPAWHLHQHNREVAARLAPEENRCALVLSLTLDLKPRKGEASLKDVKSVIPEVKRLEIANRYVRAQELANRLKDDWGKPQELKGEAAEENLRNKKGVIFFQGGYGESGSISHIDLWDGKQKKLGADIPPHFKRARRIWFWQMTENAAAR